VKWAGDSSICNSWEPADEMQRACPELVSAFEAKEPPFSSETDISALDLAGDVRTQGMSSYEMQRERNIQRNLEMLTKLGLRDVKSSFDNPCREGNQGARGKTSMLGSKRRRRAYNRWTEDEVRALQHGVTRFGIGQWTKILRNSREFNNRSTVDLKDKWRTLH
jgi:hypothetical protein